MVRSFLSPISPLSVCCSHPTNLFHIRTSPPSPPQRVLFTSYQPVPYPNLPTISPPQPPSACAVHILPTCSISEPPHHHPPQRVLFTSYQPVPYPNLPTISPPQPPSACAVHILPTCSISEPPHHRPPQPPSACAVHILPTCSISEPPHHQPPSACAVHILPTCSISEPPHHHSTSACAVHSLPTCSISEPPHHHSPTACTVHILPTCSISEPPHHHPPERVLFTSYQPVPYPNLPTISPPQPPSACAVHILPTCSISEPPHHHSPSAYAVHRLPTCSISEPPLEDSCLACHQLNQFTDRHSWRKTMRIHNLWEKENMFHVLTYQNIWKVYMNHPTHVVSCTEGKRRRRQWVSQPYRMLLKMVELYNKYNGIKIILC